MASKPFGDLVGSIDEGTSSARFALFKAGTADIVCYHQLELSHVTPNEGWVSAINHFSNHVSASFLCNLSPGRTGSHENSSNR